MLIVLVGVSDSRAYLLVVVNLLEEVLADEKDCVYAIRLARDVLNPPHDA